MSHISRNPRTQYTADAARELFLSAAEALHADSDVYEVHDLRVWRQKFAKAANEIAEERGDELDPGAATPLDADVDADAERQ